MPNSSSAPSTSTNHTDAASSSSSSFPVLAPGFRFHPTDEELVIYYLKRKVSNRPFHFDAIAEVDIYKYEPWDLPVLSRLRTRDVEWYFFSALDRRHCSRLLRTNRVTPNGFWKTSGRDRPVRRNSNGVVVGMKKTLIFHIGRAPSGQRTDWVMHEYRLEDEELARAGISQDAYVVCRIFHKSGAGPKNGEQYGAPYLEEEWEEADELILRRDGGEDVFLDDGDLEYMQLVDIGQENPTLFNGTGDNAGVTDQSGVTPNQYDGFVQFDDIAHTRGISYSHTVETVRCHDGTSSDQKSINQVGGSSNFLEMFGGEFFDAVDGKADRPNPYQMCLTAESNIYLHPHDFPNPVAGDYLSGQTAKDNTYYGEICHNPPNAQENLVQMNGCLYPSMADSCEVDMIDGIMDCFEVRDNTLPFSSLESLERSELINLPQEVDGGNDPTWKVSQEGSGANVGNAVLSLVEVPEADNQSSGRNEDGTVTRDTQRSEGQNRPLSKCFVNMLGSIPSPPASATEFPPWAMKSIGQNSGSSSLNHLTDGMIQISKQWSFQNKGEGGFFISFGMNGNVVGKLAKLTTKMHGTVMSVRLCGGWFYVFFLCALILTASFKMGIYIYTR